MNIIRLLVLVGFFLVYLPSFILFIIFVRFYKFGTREDKPRLVWGATPIINFSHWSRAMRQCGYSSETFTIGYYSRINTRSDWDVILSERFSWSPGFLKKYIGEIYCLLKYDVFFISFDGFLLGSTPLWWVEPLIFHLAQKKVVVIPYGSDAYVYRRIRSLNMLHGLMISYPGNARSQDIIARRLAKWTKYASAVLPSGMGNDGFGRWDTMLPTTLYLDLNVWQSSRRNSQADGNNDEVIIAHAPNHRGAKGTEFILQAISNLQKSGLKCRLLLLEGIQNSDVRNILQNDVDILAEQILHGTGLNGLEGMASGLPVISNFEDDSYWDIYRNFSYFNECPGVSASPDTIEGVLKKLITNPNLRAELGRAGRKYAEKYHGWDSAQYLFENVLNFVYGRTDSIINLYHPLIGEYPRRMARIINPLRKNKLPETLSFR